MKTTVTQAVSLPRGVWLALASAALFGLSTPLAKALLGQHDSPGLLAGLLYLGSGVGLGAIGILRPGGLALPAFRPDDWAKLAAANGFGGVLAPLLFVSGLRGSDAASAALLLNFESVLTALIAWVAFREHTSPRVIVGMCALSLGGVVLTWPGNPGEAAGITAPMAIMAACLCWAIDNNLTRGLAAADAVFLASLKGTSAGLVNVGIALALGSSLPAPTVLGVTMVVGLLGYGVSLVLFILALRELGTARTGAWFASAPFMGALVSVVALAEPLTTELGLAGSLMAIGLYLHLSEYHDHWHLHERLTHVHPHEHDAHHAHEHRDGEHVTEGHTHEHTHAPLAHRHPHFPDLHHRHRH